MYMTDFFYVKTGKNYKIVPNKDCVIQKKEYFCSPDYCPLLTVAET